MAKLIRRTRTVNTARPPDPVGTAIPSYFTEVLPGARAILANERKEPSTV